jgi:hypothetical protein
MLSSAIPWKHLGWRLPALCGKSQSWCGCCPLAQHLQCSMSMWVLLLAAHSDTFYKANLQNTKYNQGLCLADIDRSTVFAIYFAWNLVAIFIVPVFTMSFVYTKIIRALAKSIRLSKGMRSDMWVLAYGTWSINWDTVEQYLAAHSQVPKNQETYKQGNRWVSIFIHAMNYKVLAFQIIKMLVFMLIAFVVSWGPYLVHSFYVFSILRWNSYLFWNYRINITFTTLTFIALAINPIVLTIKSK